MDVEHYLQLKDDLFNSLVDIFDEVVNDFSSDADYPGLIFEVFDNFRKKSNLVLDFEFSQVDFEIIRQCTFLKHEWIKIYKLFCELSNRNNELTPFIKLFYCDLLYNGPFDEDVEALDMSENLLALMTDEVKKLFWLFDDYFENKNPETIKDIVNVSRDCSVPFFILMHLATWINEDIEMDSNKMIEYGDISLQLYVIANEKVLKRPVLYLDERCELGEIRFGLDTSRFGEEQIENAYSKIDKTYNLYKHNI